VSEPVPNQYLTLSKNENQARELARYVLDFLAGKYEPIDDLVKERLNLFHADSVACAIAALAIGANAPLVLRREAELYSPRKGIRGAFCFGSTTPVPLEKAVAANSSAARELDSNGTNFGYNPVTGQTRGEFGHNDFYPVVIAAAQQQNLAGDAVLRAMLCLDEVRGRLAEAFGLKDHKIDHVVHGAIASAAVCCAMLGGNVDHIESAIGMTVAHYIPFRAIRAGHQLSDSKGASAALSAEVAVLSAQRAIDGFIGPADIFRNPQAIFCLFEPPNSRDGKTESASFDIHLATGGQDFAIMGMHVKLGLYEHQSAGAIQGLIQLLQQHPELLSGGTDDADAIEKIAISIYEPAFGIIGDPAKRDPKTRQSADHSMVYIIATLLRKALEQQEAGWSELMLMPKDYDEAALHHSVTRALMQRIEFRHGGDEYDAKYPDGIPTSLSIQHGSLGVLESGLVMYPLGHSRHDGTEFDEVFMSKFNRLTSLGNCEPAALFETLMNIEQLSSEQIVQLYSFQIADE
jgi:2-methylcitrate dehydratase